MAGIFVLPLICVCAMELFGELAASYLFGITLTYSI